MVGKKVISLISFLFIMSGALLTPVLLPYISLEKEQPFQPQLDPLANPEGMEDYSVALKEQTDRNIDRLERAQVFGKWFVLNFTIFTTSGLILLVLIVKSFFFSARSHSKSQRFKPQRKKLK